MTKVLVVEDNALNMELVCDILDAKGFSTERAVDGAEAIKKAEKVIFDLIIMDIALPDMDGIEVTKIIKTNPAYKNVPVIALTAYALKGDREKFLEAGFNDYVPKPLDVSEFMKIIEKYKG